MSLFIQLQLHGFYPDENIVNIITFRYFKTYNMYNHFNNRLHLAIKLKLDFFYIYLHIQGAFYYRVFF